jgi:hypothetical protein
MPFQLSAVLLLPFQRRNTVTVARLVASLPTAQKPLAVIEQKL